MDFNAMMAELQKEYLAELPNIISKLKKVTAENNGEEVHRIFHQLKGSGKTYGFDEITELCKIMEERSMGNTIPEQTTEAIELLELILSKRSNNEAVHLNQESSYIKLIQS